MAALVAGPRECGRPPVDHDILLGEAGVEAEGTAGASLAVKTMADGNADRLARADGGQLAADALGAVCGHGGLLTDICALLAL